MKSATSRGSVELSTRQTLSNNTLAQDNCSYRDNYHKFALFVIWRKLITHIRSKDDTNEDTVSLNVEPKQRAVRLAHCNIFNYDLFCNFYLPNFYSLYSKVIIISLPLENNRGQALIYLTTCPYRLSINLIICHVR